MTKEERKILSEAPISYKYIARDKNDDLWLYHLKPLREGDEVWGNDLDCYYLDFSKHNNLFKMVQWENEEPTEISVLLNKPTTEDLRGLLKVGRVVETRDGEMGFLLEDRILYSEGWDELRRFDEDLKHEFDKDADIMTVYNCPITNGYAWHFGSEVKMFLDTIWRRKEAKVFEILDVENVMLSNLNDSFKYIARNHNGTLNIYKTKPTKQKVCWVSIDYTDFSEYAHLFKYVEWKDAEPTLIEDLIKMKTVAF